MAKSLFIHGKNSFISQCIRYIFIVICMFFIISACSSGQQKQEFPADEKEIPFDEKTFEVKKIESEKDSFFAFRLNDVWWTTNNMNLQIPKSWCYDNNPELCLESGRLYTWETALNACIEFGEGWRLPSDEEWKTLVLSAGGYYNWIENKNYGKPIEANKLLTVENKSTLLLKLGGWRGSNGGYDGIKQTGFYWSATEANEDQAWFYIVNPFGGKLTRRLTNKTMGMSCLCVMSENLQNKQ